MPNPHELESGDGTLPLAEGVAAIEMPVEPSGVSPRLALTLVEAVSDPVFVLNRSERVLYANASARRLTAVTPDNWQALCTDLFGQPCPRPLDSSCSFDTKAGEYLVRILEDVDGYVVTLNPKSAEPGIGSPELESREARLLFERIADAVPDVLYIFDVEQRRVVYANRQILPIMGYTPDQVRDMGPGVITDLTHPDDVETLLDALGELYYAADGESVEAVVRVLHAAGQYRWIRYRSVVFSRNAEGEVREILGVAQDISERKEALDALQESEKRFRELADAMPQIVWAADPQGDLYFVNERCRECAGANAGRSPDEIWLGLIHPEDLVAARSTWHAAVESGSPWQHEVRLRGADGVYRWHLARAVPIRSDEGKLLRWIGTSTDIDQQRALRLDLEARVSERTADLVTANEEMQALTYSVSHDLRAPLRAIVSASMILLRDHEHDLRDEAKKELRRQAAAAGRLGQLIDGLLTYARIARTQIRPRLVSLTTEAKKAGERLGQDYKGHRVQLRVEEDLTAFGEPRLIGHVVHALLDNAYKFAKPSGVVVHVGKRITSRGEAFYVSDNGIGFDMAYVGQLFSPFHRLVGDADYPGIGIGLAIAKRIVARHGGEIWAEGVPGKGATFYFRLPEKAPDDPKA